MPLVKHSFSFFENIDSFKVNVKQNPSVTQSLPMLNAIYINKLVLFNSPLFPDLQAQKSNAVMYYRL